MQKSLILFSIVGMAIMISYPGEAEEWISYTHANGLIENEVTSIFVRENKAWFGTANGVSMYNGCRWKNYLRDIHVNDIVEDKIGRIWVATKKGVIVFSLDREGGSRERQTHLPEFHVHAIAVDRNNVKWIGTGKGLWSTPDGTMWEDYRAAESDFAERIVEMVEKEMGSAGLKWEKNEITSIAIDANNVKWLGVHSILKTGGDDWVLTSIASFDGERFELIEESARLSTLGDIIRPGRIKSMAIDREGSIWYTRYGHEGGAFRFDGEKITVYDSPDLSGDGLWTGEQSITAAIKDGNRTILVSTAATPYDLQPRGVFLYDAETGEEIWGYRTGPAIHPNHNVAIGDVTGDGVPEIVVGGESPMNGSQANGTVDSYGYIFILDLSGRNLWGNGQSEPLTGPTGAAHQIAIADLDGDGANDIIGFLSGNMSYAPDVGTIGVGVIVTDSKGQKKNRYYYPYKASIIGSAVADLDNDGRLEVLIMDDEGRLLILNNELSLLCEREILRGAGNEIKAVADLYGDQLPEIIVANKEKLIALNYLPEDQTLVEAWSFADYECREMPIVILSDVIQGGTTEIVLSDDRNIYILGADIEGPPSLPGKDQGWKYSFFYDRSGTCIYPHAPSRPIPRVDFALKMQIDASDFGIVSLAGDVNGDGYIEMIAAKEEMISVISHKGEILWQQEYPSDNDRGVYVTALEDVLGSGNPEVLADVSESGRPKLLIIDGNTGDVVSSILTGPEAKDGLISNLVNGISVDNDGNVWFGTTGGVSRFNGESWISYRDSGGLADREVHDVFADQSNNVWFGTLAGVTRCDLSWQHPRSFRSRAEIDILQADERDAVWSGTRGDGIVKYEDGKAIAYPQWGGINQVTAMAVDRKRNTLWTSLWTNGNEPGLIRINVDTGQIASMMDWENSELVSNRITAMTMAEDGSLWLGTSQHRSIVGSERMSGLNRYNPDTDTWESWPFLIPDPNVPGSFMINKLGIPRSVNSLLLTDSGMLWIGTGDEGIKRFDTTAPGNEAWTEFRITDGIASNSINAIASTADGAIWFATPDGAIKYDEEAKQWRRFTTADGLGGIMVNDVKTAGNVVWFATNGGVSRYDGENWLSYDTGDGLASNNILSVAVDKENTLWVGTPDGLVQARRSETVPPDTFITVNPGEEERVKDVVFEYLGGDLGTGFSHVLYQHKLVPEGTPPEETRWSNYTRLTEESFAGLTHGTYTFYVRAVDRDANVDPTPAHWIFTINLLKKHGRNEIPDHDLLKTAYFITSDDDVIKYWVSQKFPSPDGNSHKKAKAAFEILGKNVCCLPKTDWEVSYPRDLLRLKVGNLNDCAILYAAILQRLEVPVMLALAPENAIVLFESDGSQQCIELDHRSLVPVFPQFDLTFDAACQSGLSIYRKRQEGEFTLLDVRKEQQRYKPVQMPTPVELYLERGVVYGQRGQYDDAIEQFESVLRIQENNAAAHNNLGNIYALKARRSDGESRLENAKKAEKYYDSAARFDPGDAPIFLNCGIAIYLQGRKQDTLITFRVARYRGGLTFEESCRCLGIDPGDDQYEDIEKLLAEAMNRQPITRADETQVISDELPLYWKLH